MISLREEGGSLQRARAQLRTIPPRLLEGARLGLSVQLAETFVRTQIRVPVRTGALRSTGRMVPAQRRGDRLEGQIAYGGSAPDSPPRISKHGHTYQAGAGVDYAVYVHEMLEANHAPPTGAKFIEGPAIEEAPRLPDRVRTATEGLLLE